jgi:hypothetical protein
MKPFFLCVLLLSLSTPAAAADWRRTVILKDGAWTCKPPSTTGLGRILYRCDNTTHWYTYEDSVPLTEESLERSGWLYQADPPICCNG